VPGRTDASVFQDALKRVVSAADAAGIAAGILAPDADTARRYVDQGVRLVGVGSDGTLLAQAGRRLVASLRASGSGDRTSADR
jgi:2-keto-3-deoxy-L-rhamnonate aldolase RhmA